MSMTQSTKAWLVVLGWVVGLSFFAGSTVNAQATTQFEIDLGKPGIYTKNQTRYIYIPQSWTRGAQGYLLVDDKPVYGPALNTVQTSPWGPLFWHGAPKSHFATRGWLPYPLLEAKLTHIPPYRKRTP